MAGGEIGKWQRDAPMRTLLFSMLNQAGIA
jgi:hypothetical protein